MCHGGSLSATGHRGRYSPQGTSTNCPTTEKYFWHRSGALSGPTRAGSPGVCVDLETTVAEAGAVSDFSAGFLSAGTAAPGRRSGLEFWPTPGTLSPRRQALMSTSSSSSHSTFSSAEGLG